MPIFRFGARVDSCVQHSDLFTNLRDRCSLAVRDRNAAPLRRADVHDDAKTVPKARVVQSLRAASCSTCVAPPWLLAIDLFEFVAMSSMKRRVAAALHTADIRPR
jgi:hypothetical protein